MKTLLMEPGPTEIDFRVVQAMVRPTIHHQSAEFADVMDRTCQLLQPIFGTRGEVVLLPASGRGGLEAAVASFYTPGSPVLILTNGVFGNMLANIARSVGADVTTFTAPPGTPFDLEGLERELQRLRPTLVGMVHCETSTGMVNPVADICRIAKAHGALTLVDAVAGLGGAQMLMDTWSVDICVTSSQKALGALAGLAAVALAPGVEQALRNRAQASRGMYLDLLRWYQGWLPRERGGDLRFGYRRLPWTMATHLVFALEEACRIILEEEGLTARLNRHARIAAAFRQAVAAAGLRVVPEPGYEAPTVTAFYPPEGVEAAEVITALKEDYGILISGGLEELRGKILRVGHMAETARPAPVVATLQALQRELAKRGGVAGDVHMPSVFQDAWADPGAGAGEG